MTDVSATQPPDTATGAATATLHQVDAGTPGARLSQTLTIPFRLPGLNDIIGEMSGHLTIRGRRVYPYTQTKKRFTTTLVRLIRDQGLVPMDGRLLVSCTWYERGRLRDPDNIASGGLKLILDALKTAGIIANDGWRNVAGFVHKFAIGRAGATITLVAMPDEQRVPAPQLEAAARAAEAELAAGYSPRMGDGITPSCPRPTDGISMQDGER